LVAPTSRYNLLCGTDGPDLESCRLLLAVLLALLVGAICGWANGMLITRAKLPAFIATLSMMTIARGLA
jgi:ribose/xylose/arabinose/galactoside ABC-type transport system permease subunit